MLDSLAPLRTALLEGDYRCLYLGWLAQAAQTEFDDDEMDGEEEEQDDDALDREPPVPAGLHQLTAELEAFAEFIDLDKDLLAAAAVASPPLTATQSEDRWIRLMPPTERESYLVQLARGEAQVVQLIRRLRELGGVDNSQPSVHQSRRIFAEIHQGQWAVKQERERREREAERQRRQQHLDDLARREPQIWSEIGQHLQSGSWSICAISPTSAARARPSISR